MDYDTLILHTGSEIDEATGALSVPVYHASTYHQKDLSKRQQFDYSRSGNPTRCAVEQAMASLESGSHAFAFASGMAAISSAIMSFLKAGDHIVVTRDIYGGAYRFFTEFMGQFSVEHTFVDATSINEIKKAIKAETRAIYIETPSNPLLTITDISAVAALCREKNIISFIDNTFMSPYFQRPIECGIDVSIHSATKFLGGHSDLLAGVVVARNAEIAKRIAFVQNTLGAVLSPNDSWILMRGIKTLGARMRIQEESAGRIAQWLKDQSWVSDVYYPGLSDHPGHDVHKAQSCGFGSVVSFKTDSVERARLLLSNAKLWAVAVSLGGVDSIMSYPWIMSHGSMPKPVKDSLGISESLIRLSVGLESAEDLIKDIEEHKNI
jgi:cystathionine beta-lyase/cystathionine gamma-synthase